MHTSNKFSLLFLANLFALNWESPVSSDRIKAPVAGAGPTDCGGDQSCIDINEGRKTSERIYLFAGTPPWK